MGYPEGVPDLLFCGPEITKSTEAIHMRPRSFVQTDRFFSVTVCGFGAGVFFAVFISCSLLLGGCRFKRRSSDEVAILMDRKAINDKYPKVIKDEILQQSSGNKVYTELEERYRSALVSFKSAAENDCVKLVVVVISPEVGKTASLANNFGIPFILETCNSLNIDCIDLTQAIAGNDINDLAMILEEINWSKNGSSYIANLFTNVILKYNSYRNTKVYPDTMHLRASGDLKPNDNEVIGGSLNLPYRLKVNAQGFRMDHNLEFPKKKQTVLFLGNAVIYQPYMDNEFIATSLLQTRFPDKEIINAGIEHYTMEDYLSLYVERLRYVEPDLVLICTDGNDILNYFFTQRNHYSRLRKSYSPTATERTFYNEVFNNGAGNN